MRLQDHWQIVTEANVGEIRMWGEPRFDAYGHETTSDIERRSEERREFRESCINGEVMELRSESMDYTPGPWHVGGIDGRDKIIYAADGLPVGNATTYHGRTSPGEMLANASLIAAAPDLLDACRAMLTCCGGSDNWNGETQEALKKIEAAIAKAMGAEHGR